MSTESARTLELRFANRLEDLTRVTAQAMAFVAGHGIGGRAAYAANLAIEEMATNILKYGYDDTAVHEIVLRVECCPGSVVVALEDDGHAFDPLGAPGPGLDLPAEERRPGGVGIHLVRQFAQDVRYERVEGRNRLTVRIGR